jgi:hypothetical protein
MSKYQPLGEFLGHLKGDYWRPTFLELERVLGFDLPASAKKKAGWWTGDDGHARSWLDAGWHVEDVSLDKDRVTFRRGQPTEAAAPQEERSFDVRERLDEARTWAGERQQAVAGVFRERPLAVAGVSTGVAFAAGVVLGLLIGRPASQAGAKAASAAGEGARRALPLIADQARALAALSESARDALPKVADRWEELRDRAREELRRLRP